VIINKFGLGGALRSDYEKFLTSTKVAEYFRIPLSTVYQLTQVQKFPTFKVGKYSGFKKSSIQVWINDQEAKRIETVATTH
jgi:predicted DNA-binding transcriptional regulator AlpA